MLSLCLSYLVSSCFMAVLLAGHSCWQRCGDCRPEAAGEVLAWRSEHGQYWFRQKVGCSPHKGLPSLIDIFCIYMWMYKRFGILDIYWEMWKIVSKDVLFKKHLKTENMNRQTALWSGLILHYRTAGDTAWWRIFGERLWIIVADCCLVPWIWYCNVAWQVFVFQFVY